MRIPSVIVANVPGVMTAAVGLAWGWGLVSSPRGRWLWIARVAITPVALLGLVVVVHALTRPARGRWARIVCASVLVYQFAMILTEPFEYLGFNDYRCACGILLLTPFFLAISELARVRDWWSVCGIALFSTASIALLIYNAMDVTYILVRSGFLSPGRIR